MDYPVPREVCDLLQMLTMLAERASSCLFEYENLLRAEAEAANDKSEAAKAEVAALEEEEKRYIRLLFYI